MLTLKDALDPSTPPTALLDLAEFVPEEVEQNPALPLLLLEDENLYRKLLVRLCWGYVRLVCNRLSRIPLPLARLFACAAVESRLPWFEQHYPNNPKPREAVVWGRRLAVEPDVLSEPDRMKLMRLIEASAPPDAPNDAKTSLKALRVPARHLVQAAANCLDVVVTGVIPLITAPTDDTLTATVSATNEAKRLWNAISWLDPIASSGSPEYAHTIRTAADQAVDPKREDERAEALDPNTPPDTLHTRAERYPEEVEQNPSLLLLALENPSTYERILDRIRRGYTGKVEGALTRLPDTIARQFVCAAVERNLRCYENYCPRNTLPREAVRVGRALAKDPHATVPGGSRWNYVQQVQESAPPRPDNNTLPLCVYYQCVGAAYLANAAAHCVAWNLPRALPDIVTAVGFHTGEFPQGTIARVKEAKRLWDAISWLDAEPPTAPKKKP